MNAESGSERSGTFTWGVIAGVAVLAVGGGLYLSGILGGSPEEETPPADVVAQTSEVGEQDPDAAATEPTSETPAVSEPDTTETTSDQAESEASEANVDDQDSATETAQVKPPSLDQIFVEPDGNAVLSGNAEPGTNVRVLLDGEQVHSFTVDPSGQFAEFLEIPFSDNARGLTLETEGDQPARSDDYVIAALPAPEPADEPVAAADTAENLAPEPEVEVAEAEPVDTDTTDTAETADATPQTTQEQTEQTVEATNEEATDKTPDQQVAILRSGEEGVELVQPPAAQPAPDQVALDTIGYSNTGDVELTGRVPDGSAVRLYIDNRLVDDLAPNGDGKWRSELDGIDPGVYTLRVDEVASDGTVVSRLETPFKREPVSVLQSAQASAQEGDETQSAPIRSVTVQEGDTLWAISRERFGDGILYVRLFEANRDSIRDPDLIYPGQIFTIPE